MQGKKPISTDVILREMEEASMVYDSICSLARSAAVSTIGKISLEWGWFHLWNLLILVLLLLPNLVYRLRGGREENLCENRLMNGMEQIGRYGSMLFMMFYVGEKGGFGFSSLFDFFCYLFGNPVLVIAYWAVWLMEFHMSGISLWTRREPTAVFVAGQKNVKQAVGRKWALVLLPSCQFLLCGITLRYVPLILSAMIFALGHSYVTWVNIKKNIHKKEGGEIVRHVR